MYEELVKRLRSAESNYQETLDCLSEAADAIEELSKQHEAQRQSLIALMNERPSWIPVTERLPEEQINPNTQDFEHVLCVTIWGDVRPFKYGTPIGHKNAHFWNGAGYVDAYITHWMPLPEPPKEET